MGGRECQESRGHKGPCSDMARCYPGFQATYCCVSLSLKERQACTFGEARASARTGLWPPVRGQPPEQLGRCHSVGSQGPRGLVDPCMTTPRAQSASTYTPSSLFRRSSMGLPALIQPSTHISRGGHAPPFLSSVTPVMRHPHPLHSPFKEPWSRLCNVLTYIWPLLW